MKRTILWLLLTVLVPGLVLAQEHREEGSRGGDQDNGRHGIHGNARPPRNRAVRPQVTRNRAPRAAVVRNRAVAPQFRSMGVRSYPKPFARNKLMVVGREHSVIAYPNQGPNGGALHATVFARTNFSSNPVIRTHMGLVAGASFRANIVGFNAHETLVNHYYWHTYGGFNYCHYYDPWGYHWYGWYLGNSYFWTRYYSNHYWWYDPSYSRWCYWHDGGWWWQDPDTTTIYVYNNGSYVSSASGSSQASSPAAAPSSNVKSADYFSKDSTREVRVLSGGDCFLYDISGDNAFKPIFLGSNVTDVKFSASNQIMLIMKDGSFASFDTNGNPIGDNAGVNAAPMNAPDNGGNNTAPQPPPSGSQPPAAPGN